MKELSQGKKKLAYILYDYEDGIIRVMSYDKTKVLAKAGEEALLGGAIEACRLIEIDLEQFEK